MPDRTTMSFMAVLAALAGGACSWPGGSPSNEEGVMVSMEEVLSRPAALELPGPIQVWTAERSSDMGVYYVRSQPELVGPARQSRSALRIVLLKGRAELRVGGVVKVSDSGAYAVVPAGTEWSLKRLGPVPLVFSLLTMPDVETPADLLRPVPK